MKINQLQLAGIIVIMAMATIFNSCKKESGATGPQGLTGPQGIQGTSGPAGSTVLSGNGIPTSVSGTNGDFYLDLSTSQFYGPKTGAGWGNGFSMRGATGAAGTNGTNGTNGNKIISGNVIPGTNEGVVGDYYLNTTTYLFYGPKTTAGWGLGISLIGAANVMYSGWMKANTALAANQTFNNTNRYSAPLPGDLPALTGPLAGQLNINSAAIFVYARVYTADAIGYITVPLPYSYYNNFTAQTMEYQISGGPERIFISNKAANNAFIPFPSTTEFRYVLVPGGVAIANAHHIDLNDTKALETLFKVKL